MNKIINKYIRIPKENHIGITDCYSCDNKKCKHNGVYKVIDKDCKNWIPPLALITIEELTTKEIEYEQLQLDIFNNE